MGVSQDEIEQLRRGLAGRYVIGAEIGVGGMSTVYRATDIRHGRDVALKLLAGPSVQQFGRRFLREIRITAGLQHPHVLPLLDSGSVGNLHFFVTPFIAGQALSQHLSVNGAMMVTDALQLTKQIAGALAHAHANNVVHLDVKPANILLSDGHAIVADFGIARAVSENCADSSGLGVAAGTPSYMSPEQVAGSSCLDGRSDVYSLACVLFEMLTGQPPFGDESSTSVLSRHLHADPPSAKRQRPSVPRYADHAILRAMAKDPADRYPSMGAFAMALEPRPWVPVTRRSLVRVPRRLRVAGASIAVAALSAFGFGVSKTAADAPVEEHVNPLAAELDAVGDVPMANTEVAKPPSHVMPC